MPQVLLTQALGTESDLALLKGVPTVTLPAAGRYGNSVACGGVRRSWETDTREAAPATAGCARTAFL